MIDTSTLARPSTPAPWDGAYVYQAVRHIARNCDFIEGDDPAFEWDRYGDASAIAALPDWIAACDERDAEIARLLDMINRADNALAAHDDYTTCSNESYALAILRGDA